REHRHDPSRRAPGARAGRHARARRGIRRDPRGGPATPRRRLPRARPHPAHVTGECARRDAHPGGGPVSTAVPSGDAPVRVLLVDDHAVMRAGFRMILEADPGIVVVGEAATGSDAVRSAAEVHPDVICMDVQMPDMDGIEATRRLTADPSVSASVVIVTTFDRDDYLFQALAAGASGFLLKNAGPEELVAAVRVAAAGDALLAPAVTRRVIERFAGQGAD